ncbi:MAG: SPASM domain-containing protein, partial [Kiritimatiellae bacterium]|nr:SPASM domain-containing protein [Kiritimatiellia bacterium]
GWQGGEPTLMGEEFFAQVTDLQQKYARPGSLVSNGLQTNATLLTDGLAAHLARYNFLCGVSLDGPPAVHDANRRTPEGQGTHAAVMSGIEKLRRYGVEFNVLTLVTQTNVRQPLQIYRYLRNSGFLFHQYIECVEFEADGSPAPYAVRGEEWGDFLCAIFDEWYATDTRRVSIRLFDSILTLMLTGEANLCQMGRDCRQYLVVEHNGDVYPCDFFVDAHLRLGNVLRNSWEEMLNSAVYRAFGARKAVLHVRCRECEYINYCAGDCPKNRLARGGEPPQRSLLCQGWRRFYAHTLPRFAKLAQEIRKEQAVATASVHETGKNLSAVRAGRNDPCPCGSGKKFKKCCDREMAARSSATFRLSGTDDCARLASYNSNRKRE